MNKKDVKTLWEPMLDCGHAMSNILFNLAQMPGWAITKRETKDFKNLQRRWDALSRNIRDVLTHGDTRLTEKLPNSGEAKVRGGDDPQGGLAEKVLRRLKKFKAEDPSFWKDFSSMLDDYSRE